MEQSKDNAVLDFHGINTIDDCRIIELEMNHHPNGNLSVVESDNQLPFDIKRVYYLYDVPGGQERGGHSHKKCATFIVAVSGSFEVEVDDGNNTRSHYLNRPNRGLYVAPGVWRTLKNFSSGSVCLVIASELYTESDYIREYEDFIKATHK